MSDQPKLIFADESKKLKFADLSAKLIFGDESKKLIFDITLPEAIGYPYTYPFTLS